MGPKAERHYKPIEGRMRYYSNGHGYFVVGEKVRYPGLYEGVEMGVVADAHYASEHNKRVVYRIRSRRTTQRPVVVPNKLETIRRAARKTRPPPSSAAPYRRRQTLQ